MQRSRVHERREKCCQKIRLIVWLVQVLEMIIPNKAHISWVWKVFVQYILGGFATEFMKYLQSHQIRRKIEVKAIAIIFIS